MIITVPKQSTLNVQATNRGASRGRGFNRFVAGRGRNINYGKIANSLTRTASLLSLDRWSNMSNGSFFDDRRNRDRSYESDGYELPPHVKRHQRKQENKRKHFITGNKQNSKFKGAPEPSRDIFIYRVDKDTSSADLNVHLSDHEFHIRDIKCVSHPDSKYKSFCVTVPVSEFNDMFDESIWPAGVRVRKYIPPKRENF